MLTTRTTSTGLPRRAPRALTAVSTIRPSVSCMKRSLRIAVFNVRNEIGSMLKRQPRRRNLDHLLDGDLEPDPDVDGVPCGVAGAGAIPDGACTVFPPGTGSAIVF